MGISIDGTHDSIANSRRVVSFVLGLVCIVFTKKNHSNERTRRELFLMKLHEKKLQEELALAGLGLPSVSEDALKAKAVSVLKQAPVTKVKDIAATLGTLNCRQSHEDDVGSPPKRMR